jgi:glyoxylate utilization-related uncharacterized protein
MPKVSKGSASQVEDHGPVEDRHEDLDGYTVNFVSFRQDIDGSPLLMGLPDDRCQCPHWGYVVKGTVTYRFADHDEVFEAGDAFYLPPGTFRRLQPAASSSSSAPPRSCGWSRR